MNIGLIGYGRFGKLAAGILARQANVLVYDTRRVRAQHLPERVSVRPLPIVAAQQVVVLAVPISALESVLRDIRPHVSRGALVIDVSSVKVWPVRWMKRLLPGTAHILGTHPLFGPDSILRSPKGRKIVVCPVKIPDPLLRKVIRILETRGLEVSVMTPADHDLMVAETLLLTQYVGRFVHRAGVRRWHGSTLHYDKLLDLVRVAERDSPELFRDMWLFNPYSRRLARKLDTAWKQLRRELPLLRPGWRA